MSDTSTQSNLPVPQEEGSLPVPKDTFAVFPDDEQANTYTTVRTSLYCGHTVHEDRRGFGGPGEEKPTELHVVPGGGAGADDTTDDVESEGGDVMTDTIEVFTSKEFKEVTVEDSAGDPPEVRVDQEVPPNEGTEAMYRYAFEVERPNPDLSAAEMGLAMLFKPQYWKEKIQETRTYTVKGLDQELKVITHYPDQWRVGFQFPAARGFSVKQSNRAEATAALFGKEVEDGEELNPPNVEEEIREGKRGRKEETEEVTFKEWGEESDRAPGSMASEGLDGTTEFFRSLKKGGPEGPVSAVVKCNGTQVSAKPVELVRSLLELGYRLQAIINTLKEAPKLGWYAEMSVQLAQGTLALTWGWQEWRDEKAYLQAGVGMHLKLFDIKAEVGIGLEVPAVVTAQAFALIQGTLALKLGPVQRSGPGMEAKVSGGVGSTLKGAIGVRVKASKLGRVIVDGESSIKLKNAEAGFDTAPEGEGGGFYLKGTLRWTGFKAKAKASVGSDVKLGDGDPGKETDGESGSSGGKLGGQAEWTIVEGKDLATWQWTPSRQHVSNQLHPDEIRSILKKVFYGGNPDPSGVGRVTSVVRQKVWPRDNVEVRELGKLDSVLPPEEVADHVAEAILKRADVKKTPDAMEGMAVDIREALRKYAEAHYITDTVTRRISQTKFMAFLHHGELDSILDDYTY